jgi:hypothetical protein
VSDTRRITSYRATWNITENRGTIRLWVEGAGELPPLVLAGGEFAAISGILFNSDGRTPVLLGRNANGDAIIGTQESFM